MNTLALVLAEQPINIAVDINPLYVDMFLLLCLIGVVYMLFTSGGGKRR